MDVTAPPLFQASGAMRSAAVLVHNARRRTRAHDHLRRTLARGARLRNDVQPSHREAV